VAAWSPEDGPAGTDPDEDFRKNSGRSECRRGRLGVVSGGELPVRILVVEDEAKVARALQEGLEAEHYEVVLSATGEDGYFRVNTGIEVGAACGQEQLKGRRGMERGRTEGPGPRNSRYRRIHRRETR